MKDCVSPYVRESKTVSNSGFQVLDSILCQWDLDFEFQSLVGFRIPWAVLWNLDSTSKYFPDSGIRISLHVRRRSVNDLFACKRFVCLICSVVQTIWTLKLTESRGESKNVSKGEAFMMAAAINVPLGRAFVKKKKKRRRMSLLRSLPCMGWCVVKIKLLMVAWVKKKTSI